MAERVKITVDGEEFESEAGTLIIRAAQDNGTYIPRFCWHERMNPVGMCRMCLVEIETPRGPMLVPSCTNTISDGMVVHTRTETVKSAQEAVLEFLLINHPLDCPVCDKGGECPLQDQTMSYGPGESRYVEIKRRYEKPVPISALVNLDRERCILCARCTRFADEICGDPLIEFADRGNATNVTTFPDLPFSSYFSGNTVQICPVGALTATPYRFRARPWDLKKANSVCQHCSTGDRISVHTSQNEVLRIEGVDSDATNHGWLSDKCRFGFEFIHAEDRLRVPKVREADGGFRDASWAEALDLVASKLAAIKAEHGAGSIAALGGARGTNEDAYALSKFMRVAIGSNHLDCQMDDGLDPQFLAAVADRATINDLDAARTILVWGPDLKEEHPTLYLRVRRAAQELGATLIVVHPRTTGLHDRATHTLAYKPGSGPEILAALKAGDGALAAARQALDSGPVVALIGRTGYTESPRLAEAVAAFIRTLPDAKVLPLARRSNVYGALDMGVAPTLLPGRASISAIGCANLAEEWGEFPTVAGKDARGIVEAVAAGDVKALLLMGADPVRDMPSGADIGGADFIVAFDQFLTDSSRLADVVLPADGFGEKSGTITNVEGRVQKMNAVVPSPGQSRPDWSTLDDLGRRLGVELGLKSAEAITAEIAHVAPAYEGVNWEFLEWDAPDGAVLPLDGIPQPLQYVPADVAGKPERAPMVLHYARTMYDDGVLMRHGKSVAPLAPGGFAALHPDDAAKLGVADAETVVVKTDVAEAELPLRIDSSLVRGTVYVPFNQPGVPNLGSGLVVEVTPGA